MSNFGADWLAMREPFDHAARNRAVLGRVAAWARGRDPITITDLGCGTGANFRFLAPRLPPCRQRWLLIDHDPRLLEAAVTVTRRWARERGFRVAERDDGLDLSIRDRRWSIGCCCRSLVDEDDPVAYDGTDLVTASALLDLVSAGWFDRAISLIWQAGAAQYWTLTYDGRTVWSPSAPEDGRILDLFNRHQLGNKGFGPALGPGAAARLAATASTEQRARCGPSDWTVGPDAASFQLAVVEGIARAATEAASGAGPEIRRWLETRRTAVAQGRSRLTVGHRDAFLPPPEPLERD